MKYLFLQNPYLQCINKPHHETKWTPSGISVIRLKHCSVHNTEEYTWLRKQEHPSHRSGYLIGHINLVCLTEMAFDLKKKNKQKKQSMMQHELWCAALLCNQLGLSGPAVTQEFRDRLQ